MMLERHSQILNFSGGSKEKSLEKLGPDFSKTTIPSKLVDS